MNKPTRPETWGAAWMGDPAAIRQNSDAIPNDKWPIWAKALKQLSTPDDKGIGDVVARIIGDENSAAFKSWYLATFGKPCGCNGRRAQWNLKYPLK